MGSPLYRVSAYWDIHVDTILQFLCPYFDQIVMLYFKSLYNII